MNTAILEVLISVISSFLGVNLKDIKASLNKENLKTSEDNVISVSIDSVCKLRSNGMPVPLLRNGYSIFNGTKYR